MEHSDDRVTVTGEVVRSLTEILGVLQAAGVPYSDLRTEQPSLEDVFLSVTGHEIRG